MEYFWHFCLIFSSVCIVRGGPVRRDITAPPTAPTNVFNNVAANTNDVNKATQIGTEQGVVSVAANNVNANSNFGNNLNNANTNNAISNAATGPPVDDSNANIKTAAVGPPVDVTNANIKTSAVGPAVDGSNANIKTTGAPVDAKLDEDHQVKPVASKGELQQSMVHPSGEVEEVYSGKPEDIQANTDKGIKQPLQTVVKPDGEIEKVYVGQPNENNKTSSEENKVMNGATATLAHDTFNISIPLKPRKHQIVKYLGNETEGVYIKSPASENFKMSCIREHNKKRVIHNAHPVVWSDKLAESAQTWADHLAEIDDDIQDTTNVKFGENIFWTRPQLPEDELCKAAVDEWYNEVKLYDFSASHKRNYDAQPVNEFTQLVYDGQTREVGVAFSLSRSNKQYVVARYYKKRNNRLLDLEVHPPHSDRARVRFDRPVFQSYNMILRLPRTSWVPQYKQENSPAYQRLQSKMKNAFKATFQESPTISSMVDFKLNNFKLDDRKPGSSALLADIDLQFYPYVTDPIQRLKSSIFNGQLNGMELDDNFLKVFNKTGVYVPPSTWKSKMDEKEKQADIATGITDPVTGAPTNVTYPQPISTDIDLLDRRPCQGGVCETYLIKDRTPEPPTNNSQPVGPAAPPPGAATVSSGQPCCNQMPPPQPCLALACPPAAPQPACDPGCPPPSALYRRGGIYFENHGKKS